MWLKIRSAAVIVALLCANIVAAQDVTLIARNGDLEFSGQLAGYDGEYYRIDTIYGRLTVNAEGVICEGPACPDLMAPQIQIRVTGAKEPARRLIVPLFAAFARTRGLNFLGLDDYTAELRDPGTDQPLAKISFVDSDTPLAAIDAETADLSVGFSAPAGYRNRTLGAEPLLAIVARDNRFPHIRSADLAAALTGKVTNWAELGGPDMPIVVHGQTGGLGAAAVARLAVGLAPGPRHDSSAALAAAVARDPWALALTGLSVKGDARALPLTDGCDFPLPATREATKAEDYPLVAPIFLTSARRRMPLLLREFHEFLATDAAQEVVEAAGYVDRRLSRAPLTADGERLLGAIRNAGEDVSLTELQRLAAAMTGGERLSLTFRFQGGSAQLDAQSRDNLEDLARYIASGAFRGERLTLAGFSDGTGASDKNLALSKDRAGAVLNALRRIAPDIEEADLPGVDAFGEALPMACDSTPRGRQVNRRVELWVHPARDAAP